MSRPPVAVNDSRRRGVELAVRYVGLAATVTAAAVAVIGLSGCGSEVAGVAVAGDISTVATAPTAAAVPSSLGKTATLEELAADTAAQAIDFWRSLRARGTKATVIPVSGALSCGEKPITDGSYAVFCGNSDEIKYVSDELQVERDRGGDLAVEITIAHEVAHAAQDAEGYLTFYPDDLSAELSADCAAGAYLRNTGVDPNAVRRALSATALGTWPPETRIAAFTAGFTGAVQPMACLTNYLK